MSNVYRHSNSWKFILAFFVLIFPLVVAALLYSEFSAIGTDGVVYTLLGKSIADGNGLTLFGQPHTVFSPFMPFLIAILYRVIGNLEVAAFAQNAIVALMALPLLFVLLGKIHSRKAAYVCTTIFATSAGYIFSFLTPSPQVTIITLGILLFILMHREPSWKTFLGIGTVSALMYLDRPEYFFIPIPILLYLWIAHRKKSIVFVLVGFIVLALPYLIFLRSSLGYWTFTGRASGTALYITDELNVGSEAIEGDNGLTPAVKRGGGDSLTNSILHNPGAAAKKLFKGLRDSERNTTRVFGFIGIGLFAFGIRYFLLRKRFRELGIALVITSPVLAVALGQGGSGNYLIQFFFLIFIFMAIGLVELLEDLKKQSYTAMATIIVGLYLFFPVPQSYLFMPRENLVREYKMMGVWMKQNVPEVKNQTILLRKPETAFYADAQFINIPKDKSITEIISYMKENNIRYLVLGKRHAPKEYPQLMPLFDNNFTNKELNLVHRVDYLGNDVVLYFLVFSS